jgi:hypothetical protein
MKKLIISAVLIASLTTVSAQNIDEIKSRYPGENAVVLRRQVQYDLQLKDGAPYVESRESQQLLYLTANTGYLGRYVFYHSTFNELKDYSAYTETTANKKIKVTNFKTSNSSSGSVFYDDTKETRFDFPSVGSGAIGNLEYSVVHTKPYLLSPFYFARRIPVIKNELKISVPANMSIKYVLRGLDTSCIHMKLDRRRNETTYTFYVENMAPAKSYADAPDDSWYEPHVVFFIDRYKNVQGNWVNYLSNVDDLYKLNSSFLKNVNNVPGDQLARLVDSLTQGKIKQSDKARAIYEWVQNHIKYIAFEDGMGGFVPRDPNLVLHRRFGDCKDMAGLLTMMLNKAGITAYYTWIGTRDLPYSYHETPLPIVDNHMISTAIIDGEYKFFDGTNPYCVFGTAPAAIQGKEALVAIDSDTYKILNVPIAAAEVNRQFDSTYMELGQDGLKGSITMKLSGYYATSMHGYLQNLDESDKEKSFNSILSRGSNKFHLTSYSADSITDKNFVALHADFTLDGYAKRIDNEWYVNMVLSKLYEHEEIDFPKRKMPVEKEFLYTREYVTELKIPDGYKVSYIPANKSFKNEAWGFEIRYTQTKNSVVCALRVKNEHLLITNDLFEQWNKVLENLYPAYKESVILSKN